MYKAEKCHTNGDYEYKRNLREFKAEKDQILMFQPREMESLVLRFKLKEIKRNGEKKC